MEVVSGDNWTTWAISRAKHQSNPHHQQTNIQFFPGWMPFLSPNQQCQSTEGKTSHSMDLLTPNSPGGVPTLSLTTNICQWPLRLFAVAYCRQRWHARVTTRALTEWFFRLSVLRESSCLHYLLPDKRDSTITDRLRHAETFTSFPIRTEKFRKSFIPYCLNLYH